MRTRQLRERRREAYTLIELLLVITIIAVLAGLTLAGVMKVLSKPPEVTARNEMAQMDGAVQQFLSKYDAKYLPSRIRLCPNYNTYQPGVALDDESVRFITQTIGKNEPGFVSKWKTGIQWAPNLPAAGEILEGHQCLVFFLGGIQTKDTNGVISCNGFNPDARNPDVPPAPGKGVGPFFQFDPRRLSVPPGKYFAAYEDAYGKKQYYAYFSSFHGNSNDYNHFASTTAPPKSDCASLGLWPYAASPKSGSASIQFVNKDSWQIICAGADGTFGPGTDLTAPPASQYYWTKNTAGAIAAAGKDDQANFARGKLEFGE